MNKENELEPCALCMLSLETAQSIQPLTHLLVKLEGASPWLMKWQG